MEWEWDEGLKKDHGEMGPTVLISIFENFYVHKSSVSPGNIIL